MMPLDFQKFVPLEKTTMELQLGRTLLYDALRRQQAHHSPTSTLTHIIPCYHQHPTYIDSTTILTANRTNNNQHHFVSPQDHSK